MSEGKRWKVEEMRRGRNEKGSSGREIEGKKDSGKKCKVEERQCGGKTRWRK